MGKLTQTLRPPADRRQCSLGTGLKQCIHRSLFNGSRSQKKFHGRQCGFDRKDASGRKEKHTVRLWPGLAFVVRKHC